MRKGKNGMRKDDRRKFDEQQVDHYEGGTCMMCAGLFGRRKVCYDNRSSQCKERAKDMVDPMERMV